MTYSASATELKQNLSHYLKIASEAPVSITKNGKIVAVLIGPEIRKEIAMRNLKGILPGDVGSAREIRKARLEKYL